MKSDIHFLNELDEDLSEATWRESLKGTRTRRPRAVRRRPRQRIVITLAGVVAFLTLAGAIGWFVTRGQEGTTGNLRPDIAALGSRVRALASAPPSAIHNQAAPGFAAFPSNWAATVDMDAALQRAAADVPEMQPGTVAESATLSLSRIQIPGDMTRIVKTGQLSIVVGSGTFEDKFRQAGMIAATHRGYVQSSSTSGTRSGTLTIRVPATRFETVMNALAALGTRVESQSVTGKNVTSQFVDLNARLSVWQQQQRVLSGLLAHATSPETTIRYTNLVMDVQFRIEEIKGQLRVLKNEADMSTIKASLREEGAPVPTPKPEKVAKPNLGNAFQHAVAGFLAVVFAVVVGLGYLVPVSVLLALAALVFLRVRRRRGVV